MKVRHASFESIKGSGDEALNDARLRLRRNYENLIEDIQPEPLLIALFARGALSYRQKEDIQV